MKAFIDTETCGLHGMAVTLQYAYSHEGHDGEIKIHEFWRRPIHESLSLIEDIAKCEVVGFNLAFDWFHLCKIYTTFSLFLEKTQDKDAFPDEHINELAILEKEARDGPCLKPFKSLDLMLHARKTEFQITMERSDIRIRKVPTVLAWSLAKQLEKLPFNEILFARSKNKLAPRWTVRDVIVNGKINPDFKDVLLKFKPSSGLKALALYALNETEILSFKEIEIDKKLYPFEYGYAPYALAVANGPYWIKVIKHKGKKVKAKAWPAVIQQHINHWAFHEPARVYAAKDVEYTRKLWYYFDCPEAGDDDSELATMVGAVRWRGYFVDIEGIKALKEECKKKLKETPTSPSYVKRWIGECLSESEKAVFTSTGKVVLEKMAAPEQCPVGSCEICNNTGMLPTSEASKRARAVLDARMMGKEIELYDKLILAGRFHASFKVIGALSGRMAGADSLNAQGIKRTTEIRSKFPLAFGDLELEGGDFSGFEVVLADSAYNDPLLRKDLLTCEKCRDVQVIYKAGKKKCPKCGGNKTMKIHALFGVHVYPEMNYDQIKATEGTADDRYTKSKSAVFAMIYGGEGYTLMTRLGVPIEVADEAFKKFGERYPGIAEARKRIFNAFAPMRQEAGIGSKIIWSEPQDYVESLLGFKRYFTLENETAKALFNLAESPPKEWTSLKIKVIRRDREQSVSGALRSAVFAAAFQIQAANVRAAANHEIQSSGAQITKHVQRRVWDVQPPGVHQWLVQPCNIHDQVLTPTHPSVKEKVRQVVFEAVESFREKVPLIEFDYKPMKDWSTK